MNVMQPFRRRTLAAGMFSALAMAALGIPPASASSPAEAPDGPIASPEPGWPQWRGPRRDGVSDETGLLPSWPQGGPKLLWKADGLGRGYASPVISGGSLYITGDFGEELRITSLDLEGKVRWTAVNGKSWTKNYRGSRASCAVSEGRVYHMNAHGRVACLEAGTGREIWSADLQERFATQPIRWGLSECLLVDGPRLIVTPGGPKCLLAALDKTTGRTVWTSEPIDGDWAGYASPILFRRAGRRLIAGCSSRHAFCVDADSGRLLWTVERPTRYEVIAAAPVYCGGAVFVTSPDGRGGAMLRIDVEGEKVSVAQQWACDLDNVHGGAVLAGGRLFGAGHFNKGWFAVDAATGKTLYKSVDLDMGSAIWADGRLYCLSERGEAALLRPTDAGFETAGRFTFVPPPAKQPDVWPHPVLLDGRLYLRYHDSLSCYDVKAPKP